MSIVEFLLARIAEDEQRTLARIDAMTTVAERWPTLDHDTRALIDVRRERRLLAECQANRAIVALADAELAAEVQRRDASAMGAGLMHREVLLRMAAVYADHPDYQQEWAA